MSEKKFHSPVLTLVVTGLLLGHITAGYLIASKSVCFAGPSLYVSPQSKPPWGDEDSWGSRPVIVGDRLYLYTLTPAGKCRLWRGGPKKEDDPNLVWSEINLTDLNSPDITALGSHKEHLYVATREGDSPRLRLREDPNQGEWIQVNPSEMNSGTITSISSFNDYLYLGVTVKGTEDTADSVRLWRSKEAKSTKKVASTDWKQIGQSHAGLITTSNFQEFEDKLYLGVKNTQDKAEVWMLDKSDSDRTIFSPWSEGALSIADMAASDHTLSAIMLDNDDNGSAGGSGSDNKSTCRIWSMAWNEANFSEAPSSWEKTIDPNQSASLSMESLGSYLFLGFNNTDKKMEICQAYHDPNQVNQENKKDQEDTKEKRLEPITVNDMSKPQEQTALDASSNHFRWLYADHNQGYLYLGTEDPNQGITLWRSNKLPIITIIYDPSKIDAKNPETGKAYPYTFLGTFNSKVQENMSVEWKSTKKGSYTVDLIQLKDPNDAISQDPDFSIPSQQVDKEAKEIRTILPVQKQGTYVVEIAWHPDPNSSVENKERYPVLFSLINDTAPPETAPSVISVTSGNEKLLVKWSEAHDKLSGVKLYRVQWAQVPPEVDAGSDPNTIEFPGENIHEQSKDENCKYTIDNLINGQRYVVLVSAIDAANNATSRSAITGKSFGTPVKGLGLTDLVDESGGCFLETVRKDQIIFRRREKR
ncbi:MAG: fibronectin type III domain-containing protein [bacterium]